MKKLEKYQKFFKSINKKDIIKEFYSLNEHNKKIKLTEIVISTNVDLDFVKEFTSKKDKLDFIFAYEKAHSMSINKDEIKGLLG